MFKIFILNAIIYCFVRQIDVLLYLMTPCGFVSEYHILCTCLIHLRCEGLVRYAEMHGFASKNCAVRTAEAIRLKTSLIVAEFRKLLLKLPAECKL